MYLFNFTYSKEERKMYKNKYGNETNITKQKEKNDFSLSDDQMYRASKSLFVFNFMNSLVDADLWT